MNNFSCIVTAPYFTCISGNMGAQRLLTVDVTSNAVQIISKPLMDYISLDLYDGNLRPLDANSVLPGFIIDDKKVMLIKDNDFVPLDINIAGTSSATIIEGSNGHVLVQVWDDKTLVCNLLM